MISFTPHLDMLRSPRLAERRSIVDAEAAVVKLNAAASQLTGPLDAIARWRANPLRAAERLIVADPE